MIDDSVISRAEGWLSAWIGPDLMMMNAESSFYLNLTGSGGRIWELLERPQTIADLCRTLAREYEIEPPAALPEVTAFLDQLLERKAIDVHPAPVA
jgi:hypothetical protein